MSNCFIYKLNKNIKNEFVLNNSNDYKNYFIIEDIDLINPYEIIRLLKNGRKVIFGDFSIISTSFLRGLEDLISKENNSFIGSLFLSKEMYIKTLSFKKYADIIKELEFNNKMTEKNIFLSDERIHCALKVKDLYDKNIVVKKLDQSTFMKNLVLEKFFIEQITIEEEIKEITNAIIFFKKYLIESVILFFEKDQNNNMCYSIDKDFSNNYRNISEKNIGILSAFDFDKETNCSLLHTECESANLEKENKCGWIDIVKAKNLVHSLGIEKIVIENISLYDNLEEIQVCNEYGIKNYSTKIFSKNDNQIITPFYIKFDGWNKDVSNISDEAQIPIELLYFLNEIKKLIGVKIISTKLTHLEINIGEETN